MPKLSPIAKKSKQPTLNKVIFGTYSNKRKSYYLIRKSFLEYFQYCPAFLHMMRIDSNRYRKMPVPYHWTYKKAIQRTFNNLAANSLQADDISERQIEDEFIKFWLKNTTKKMYLPAGMTETDVILKAKNTLVSVFNSFPKSTQIVRSNYKYSFEINSEILDRPLLVSGILPALLYRKGKYNKENLFVVSALYPMRPIDPEGIPWNYSVMTDYYGLNASVKGEFKQVSINNSSLIFADLSTGRTYRYYPESLRKFGKYKNDIVKFAQLLAISYNLRNVGEHCAECYLRGNCIKKINYEVI